MPSVPWFREASETCLNTWIRGIHLSWMRGPALCCGWLVAREACSHASEMARASTMLCLCVCVCGVCEGVHMRARAPERHARANSTHTRQQETRGLSPSRGSPNRPAHRADRSNARRTNPAASPDEGARASGTFRQTKRERLRPEPACQGRNGRPQRVAPSPTDSRPPLHAGNNGCTYTPYQRRKRWQPAEHGGLTKQHGPASARQTRTR